MITEERTNDPYERFASGMASILIGTALVVVDIHFSAAMGSPTIHGDTPVRVMKIDCVPDFIGFLLLTFGYRACAKAASGRLRSGLSWVIRWYWLMVVLAAAKVAMDTHDASDLAGPWRVVESVHALVDVLGAWLLVALCRSLALAKGHRAWRRLALFQTVMAALSLVVGLGFVLSERDAVEQMLDDAPIALLLGGALLYLVAVLSLFLAACITARNEALRQLEPRS